MKPENALAQLDAEIARADARLNSLRQARRHMAEAYGLLESSPVATRAIKRRLAGGVRRVLRGAGHRGKRQAPIAPGSLKDRIIEVLTERKAPMRGDELRELVKARKPDVTAARKELLAEKRIVPVGGGRWIQYAVPEFANVRLAAALGRA
jgi:hypothetical protein